MCLSPGPSSVDGEDTYPSAFDRVSVAHQGQSMSHCSLQTDVSCLPQTQQTRDDLLLQPAREVIEGDYNVQKWIRIWQMVGHKRTETATPLVSGNSSRWKLSSSTLLMVIFTSVTRWRLLTSALVRLSTLTRAIIYKHTEQLHLILKHYLKSMFSL